MGLLERLRDPVFGGRLGLLGGDAADRIEELEAAITSALHCTPSVSTGADGFDEAHIVYDCGDPWEILRHALALSKGSEG